MGRLTLKLCISLYVPIFRFFTCFVVIVPCLLIQMSILMSSIITACHNKQIWERCTLFIGHGQKLLTFGSKIFSMES